MFFFVVVYHGEWSVRYVHPWGSVYIQASQCKTRTAYTDTTKKAQQPQIPESLAYFPVLGFLAACGNRFLTVPGYSEADYRI